MPEIKNIIEDMFYHFEVDIQAHFWYSSRKYIDYRACSECYRQFQKMTQFATLTCSSPQSYLIHCIDISYYIFTLYNSRVGSKSTIEVAGVNEVDSNFLVLVAAYFSSLISMRMHNHDRDVKLARKCKSILQRVLNNRSEIWSLIFFNYRSWRNQPTQPLTSMRRHHNIISILLQLFLALWNIITTFDPNKFFLFEMLGIGGFRWL